MSIPMEELKAYKWPKPNFPIGQEVLDRTTRMTRGEFPTTIWFP